MRFSKPLLLVVLTLTSCRSSTEQQPSVDGYAGGTIAGGIKADRIAADAIVGGNVQATVLSAQELRAQGLAIGGDASVAGAFEAKTLETSVVATSSLAIAGTELRFPIVRGSARRTDEFVDLSTPTSGYDASDEACRGDFGPAAHACGAQEMLLAWYITPNAETLNLDGAVVNVFTPYMAGILTGVTDNATHPLIIDDCQGWLDVAPEGGLRLGGNDFGPREEKLEQGQLVEFVHGYLAVHPQGGRPVMRPHNNCLLAFDVACCEFL